MKILYLECGMGAAGDMLSAALLELLSDRQAFLDKMNALGLPGIHVEAEKAIKCGITGTHIKVTVDGKEEEPGDIHPHDECLPVHMNSCHHHSSVEDINSLIDGLAVSGRVKADAKAVYSLIADAESQVHGQPVHEIHFHEVGMMDAVADVIGVCLLMEAISADEVVASPVNTGSGYVHCAHGMLPVPTPATAVLLNGIPAYSGQIQAELCTPTGAALLKYFVNRFGDRPVMKTEAVGYGMGKKDFDRANCVRAFLGEKEGEREKITKLECNLDDMTGEDIGFAMEQLFKAGARDVHTQAIGMKKSRPGVMLSVICLPEDADRLAALMMKHTATLGIRRQDMSRYVLKREIETVETRYGTVRIKIASGMGVTRRKAEFNDLTELAEKHGVSLSAIRKELK